jgi:signal transduction histidine kinase
VDPVPITRSRRLDLLLVVLAAADAVSVVTSDEPHRISVSLLAASSVLVLIGRRQAPLAVSVAAFALLAVGTSLAPTSTAVQFACMLVVFVVVGAINPGRQVLVVAGAGVGFLLLATVVVPPGGGWPDFLLSTAICIGLLCGGWLLAHRSRQLDHVRAESALARRQAQERARVALSEERARIARELHDVVSHGLSVVVVQGQAARGLVEDLSADEAGRASVVRHLEAVESTARDALAEMRRMLGLLQLDEPGESAPQPPSPGVCDLPALVERGREAGLPIAAELPEQPPDWPSGLSLTVYRIVQESLTNVVKHAPGAPTTVSVLALGDRVEVQVRNGPGRADRAVAAGGHGLVGMRERVAMYDGRLHVGPTPDGGFEVGVVLPSESGSTTAAALQPTEPS